VSPGLHLFAPKLPPPFHNPQPHAHADQVFSSESKKLLLRCWTVAQVASRLNSHPLFKTLFLPECSQLLAQHAQGRAALIQARALQVIVSFIDGDDAAALLDAEAAAAAQNASSSSSATDATKDEPLASSQVADVCVKLAVAFIQAEDSRAAALQSELPRALLQLFAQVPGSGLTARKRLDEQMQERISSIVKYCIEGGAAGNRPCLHPSIFFFFSSSSSLPSPFPLLYSSSSSSSSFSSFSSS
jgi:hypothetical protein